MADLCLELCREVEKGKGIRRRYARASIQPDTTVGTVRLSISIALTFSCDLSSNKGALLCLNPNRSDFPTGI